MRRLLIVLAAAILLTTIPAVSLASATQWSESRQTWVDDQGNYWDASRDAWADGKGHWYKWEHWRNADWSVYKLPDGKGHFWFWGAWRYEDGSLYIPTSPPTRGTASTYTYSHTGSVEQWRGAVAAVFPAWAVEAALRVIRCESGGNPNATGSAGERGLFQIHPVHHDSTYDVAGNIRAAYRISNGGTNWGPWTCKP